MGSGGFRNEGREAEPEGLGDGNPPAGSRGIAPGRVWGQSPQKPTTHYENNCQKHRILVGQSKNNEIEGFGGRPPVGGGPGPPGPPKSGPGPNGSADCKSVKKQIESCRVLLRPDLKALMVDTLIQTVPSVDNWL